MLEDRLMTNEFKIDRRDAIRARNQANERRQKKQRQAEDQTTEERLQGFWKKHRPTPEAVAALSVANDPNLENWYVPVPGPPKHHRSDDDDEPTGLTVMGFLEVQPDRMGGSSEGSAWSNRAP
eukprot:278066-Amphidinium_carterae.1